MPFLNRCMGAWCFSTHRLQSRACNYAQRSWHSGTALVTYINDCPQTLPYTQLGRTWSMTVLIMNTSGTFSRRVNKTGFLLGSEKQQNEIFVNLRGFILILRAVIVSARNMRKKFGEFCLQQHYYDIIFKFKGSASAPHCTPCRRSCLDRLLQISIV